MGRETVGRNQATQQQARLVPCQLQQPLAKDLFHSYESTLEVNQIATLKMGQQFQSHVEMMIIMERRTIKHKPNRQGGTRPIVNVKEVRPLNTHMCRPMGIEQNTSKSEWPKPMLLRDAPLFVGVKT